jgi:Flp pilus assembly protein TadD
MKRDTERLLAADTQRIDLRETVDLGILHCQRGDWETGVALLRKAARKKQREMELPSLYYSYLGYGAAFLDGERRDGLRLCKHAVQIAPQEPDNYLNLARVYLLAGDRRHAVAAVQRGLILEPRHGGLLALRRKLGYRRKPVFSFLSRDSWINRWLGRRRHRRDGATSE